MTKRPVLFRMRLGASYDELTVFNRVGGATVYDRAQMRKDGKRDEIYKVRVALLDVFRSLQRKAGKAQRKLAAA